MWRHPVKSMRGEEVAALDVRPGGVAGDRVYVFVDARTGERISAKRHGALLGCAARLLTEPTAGSDAAPPVEVTFPDGAVVADDPAEVSRRVSDLLETEVRMVAGAPGAFVDAAPLHVMATSTLHALTVEHPEGDWDPRRTRPNILIDDEQRGGQADADDAWLSRDLHVGAAVVAHVVIPTPRCVMTTLPQDDLPADRDVLRTLNEVRRRRLGDRDRPCAGVYAAVVTPGGVEVGDPVTVTAGALTGDRISANNACADSFCRTMKVGAADTRLEEVRDGPVRPSRCGVGSAAVRR
ncbi:MOSC domain-containing protein [Mycolicibacterium thermoresistibile]